VKNFNLIQLAGAGFLVGVLFHVCVALAVLDDGSSSESGTRVGPVITPAVAAPTATRLPDRTSCAEIAGSEYRSDTERDWFRANC
jgi:hypothetical protein